MEKTKTCTVCKATLPLSEFYKNKASSDGHGSRCISCSKVYARDQGQKRKNDPNYAPRKRTSNGECRTCGRKEPDVEFYPYNKGGSHLLRNCKGCEAIRARKWRESNRQNRTPNPDADAARRMKRRALESGASIGELPAGWRSALMDFYGHACLKCGSFDNLEVDHVVPLSRGGAHELSNFQVLCRSCNRSKHAGSGDYRGGRIFSFVND